ncbi:Dynamin-like GTPase that mediates homotypic ER fusion, partial [Haplosporangium sp. Z 27]
MDVVPDIDHPLGHDNAVPDVLESTISSDSKKDGPQPRLHLIDEQQKFSDSLSTYIANDWGLKDAGFNYNLAAVFGSQSTGK